MDNELIVTNTLKQGSPEWLVEVIADKASELRTAHQDGVLTRELAIKNRFTINCAIDLLAVHYKLSNP